MKFVPYNEEQRFDQIKRNIPSFFTYKLKDLLYIGVTKTNFQFQEQLNKLKYEITLLEAHPPNLELYLDKYVCICADITEFEDLVLQWDVIMWWHGPEHISKEELAPTLEKLELMAKKLVILGCPWGIYLQGISNNNKYQIHKNHIYPKDLLKLGYSVETIGNKDKPGSNLLAWKML